MQIMLLSPSNVCRCQRMGEDGMVEQTLRWTQQVPFGEHQFDVIFAGEISPVNATLWCWVTNFSIDRAQRSARDRPFVRGCGEALPVTRGFVTNRLSGGINVVNDCNVVG